MPSTRRVFAHKSSKVLSIQLCATAHEAIKTMADSEIGSLLVLESGRLVGIFTEQYRARNVFLKGCASPQTLVSKVMEKRVVCIHPNQQVEEGMALMSNKRVRHLPVIDDGNVLGLASIGDLVKSIIRDKGFRDRATGALHPRIARTVSREAAMRVLLILNDPTSGTEGAYNALRLASALNQV